ncbi:MAG: DUF4836 family protein [Bacteroidota bacterium]
MNFRNNVYLALLSVSFLFFSCGNDTAVVEDAIINIPASTSALTSIDIKSLMEKADFESVKKMSFYQDMIDDVAQNNPNIVSILKDPSQSGVDLNAKMYFVQDMNINNPENSVNALLMSLKDKAAFEKMVSSEAQVASGEGFQYIQPNKNNLVAWNDELGVVGMSPSSRADIQASVAEFFATTKETSVVNNEDLQKCLSKKSDVVSWFSSNSLAELAKGDMGMAMAFVGLTAEMLENNFAHSYMDFGKGEITGDSKYWINEKMADEFRHIFKDEVKTNFAQYLPEQDLAFAFSGALDIKGIKMILEKRQMAGLADMNLREFGLSVDELAKTFDGDFMVSGYREEGSDIPNMMTVLKINDKANFQKILDLGEEYEMISKAGDGVYNLSPLPMGGTTAGVQPQLYFDGKVAFMSSNTKAVSAIQSGDWGKSGLVGSEVKDVINENLMGAFINFATIGKLMDSSGLNFDAMENAYMSMDRDEAAYQVNMKDKSQNSLKSIFELLNQSYERRNSM